MTATKGTTLRGVGDEEDSCSVERFKHGSGESSSGVRSKAQLWRFLLELLRDTTNFKIITWEGEYGEFRMNNPEQVAKLWGKRSGRRKMTYQIMSRALRHYYSKGILSKVKHKKWCYRFSFDILKGSRNSSNSTCLPAPKNIPLKLSEYYNAPLAYDWYLKTVLLSLQIPKTAAMYPRDRIWVPNRMKWSFVPGFGGSVLYDTYSRSYSQ